MLFIDALVQYSNFFQFMVKFYWHVNITAIYCYVITIEPILICKSRMSMLIVIRKVDYGSRQSNILYTFVSRSLQINGAKCKDKGGKVQTGISSDHSMTS